MGRIESALLGDSCVVEDPNLSYHGAHNQLPLLCENALLCWFGFTQNLRHKISS